MKARIDNVITIQMLEHQAAHSKSNDVPAKWEARRSWNQGLV
jgi:hypothetical protein